MIINYAVGIAEPYTTQTIRPIYIIAFEGRLTVDAGTPTTLGPMQNALLPFKAEIV